MSPTVRTTDQIRQPCSSLLKAYFVPYVAAAVEKLTAAAPADEPLVGPQHAVLLIDAWSVHRIEEFLTYMSQHHPLYHVVIIPGGTTGTFQPADVALNRPFEHFMRNAYMTWAAANVAAAISKGVAAADVKLGNAVGPLRNMLAKPAH